MEQFEYEELSRSAIDAIKAHGSWHRVVSIDLETKITKKEDFLSGERILAVGMARRMASGIESRTFTLKEETDEAEIALLYEAARYLQEARPLVLLGYNISGYDFPLLCLKLKWHDDLLRNRSTDGKPVFPREYWALKDALTRTYILDLMHPLRFEIARHDKATPKYKSLADVVDHQCYASLPLMRRKQLASSSSQEGKGARIYSMWKAKDPDFERYLEGDVHDVLVLAECLYGAGITAC
jgi:DNA polymerase elongation subunit (family B)